MISVVQCRPELQKISFVAHSLGGLIARYAIALLYEPATQTDCHEEYEKDVNDACSNQPMGQGKIAGLEPMNFITFATPHLGTRSHKQVIYKFCSTFCLYVKPWPDGNLLWFNLSLHNWISLFFGQTNISLHYIKPEGVWKLRYKEDKFELINYVY